jgi:SAM-dependent methyltransferase
MTAIGARGKEIPKELVSTERQAKPMARVIRALINSQIALSSAFDLLLPRSFRIDGAKDFKHRIVPLHFRPSLVIYDIGGGARPCVASETKRHLGLRLVGVDIGREELAKAPPGIYDQMVVADITRYQEKQAADLVVCKSTLEHVRNTEAALTTMAELLKPGGMLLVFTPCRNAMFARLNRLLPERFKRRLLSFFMSDKADHLGFPAFYDRCTPRDFRRFVARQGLELVELRPYYMSTYFSVVFPVYVLWRIWIVASRLLAGENAAETFALLARKPGAPKRNDEIWVGAATVESTVERPVESTVERSVQTQRDK